MTNFGDGVEKRLKNLSAQNPHEVELLHSVRFEENTSMVESYLHTYFKKYNHRYEWFILNDEQIELIKKELVSGFDIKLVKKQEIEDWLLSNRKATNIELDELASSHISIA